MTSSFVKTEEVNIETYEKLLILNQSSAKGELKQKFPNNNIYPWNIKNQTISPLSYLQKNKDVWKAQVKLLCYRP